MTMLFYALFLIWGVVALVALFLTDRSARDIASRFGELRSPVVIARADGTSNPEEACRRATG